MHNRRSDLRPLGSLHVAELARKAHVTPATIRYYSRVGLVNPAREPDNGYRCFSTADLHRVAFIRQAQALGLTIGDIKAILETIERGDTPCQQVRALVEQRLVSMREKIAELRASEARIAQAVASWREMADLPPANGQLCPLIERLGDPGASVSPAKPAASSCIRDNCHCQNADVMVAA